MIGSDGGWSCCRRFCKILSTTSGAARRMRRTASAYHCADACTAPLASWTSASRKSVLPIVEQRDHLLIYPTQYEGMEQCSNIFYTGAAPNQQIIPAVSWTVGFLRKKRFFLVG